MYADPVIGESFFGRTEVLTLLNKRIDALKGGYRQNIAITGQRLCGKTSLIHQFLYILKDSNIIPIYVEIADESFENFVDKFIGTLLYNFFKTYIENVPEDITALLDSEKRIIPKTVESIEKIRVYLKDNKFEEAFTLLFGLTSIIREETGKPCVVILDEFHNLDLFSIKNPFANFGKRIMIQKDTMYIVASSEINKIKKILSEKLALLFGNFEKIELDSFDSKTSRNFLRERLSPARVNDDILNFIIYFVEGHPYYLDVLVDKLHSKLSGMKFKMITKSVLFDIFEEELFKSKGTFNQYFMNSIDSFKVEGLRRELANVILALSEGNYKLKDITVALSKFREKDISKKLSKLIELNFILKRGAFYKLSDKVMEFWLKNVYNKKQKSFVTSVEDLSSQFRNCLTGLYQSFEEESKKNIITRIELLLKSFNNEIIEIDKKSHRLPKFSQIEAFGEDQKNVLLADADGKKWAFIVEEKEVREADLFGYVSRLKSDKLVDKIVLISLCGIEMNAKLIAKESKVWIWELEDVNFLMDVYKKIRIIL